MVGEDGTRAECIARYEQRLMHDAGLLAALEELLGLVLGCWCAPRACHGDAFARLANLPPEQREQWARSG